jgi:hypothetical protein
MMVKSVLDFLFLNSPSPFRVTAAQCKYICPEWPNWPGSLAGISFKINSRSLFTMIYKLKNDNFKIQDFSPLIERVTTVSFSSCQRNLIKTFQIEAIIALITKMAMIFSLVLLNGQK